MSQCKLKENITVEVKIGRRFSGTFKSPNKNKIKKQYVFSRQKRNSRMQIKYPLSLGQSEVRGNEGCIGKEKHWCMAKSVLLYKSTLHLKVSSFK